MGSGFKVAEKPPSDRHSAAIAASSGLFVASCITRRIHEMVALTELCVLQTTPAALIKLFMQLDVFSAYDKSVLYGLQTQTLKG